MSATSQIELNGRAYDDMPDRHHVLIPPRRDRMALIEIVEAWGADDSTNQ